jgi:imidazolonepropionase-like amidohydrolase
MSRLISTFALLALALPAAAGTTAITGGKVHTVGPQGTIENATILIVDGRIAAIGDDVEVPAGAETIDAAGKIITPGLFSPFGQLGLVEVGLSAGPSDYAQRGSQFTAGFDVADAYNPRSSLIAINRIEGVTRAVVAPMPGYPSESGAGHVLAGLAAIVNLGDDNALDRRAAAMVVTLGEYGAEHKGDFERGMRRDYVHSMNDLEALQGVVNGNTPMIVGVDRASDIEVLIELVNEYGVTAIISGGSEAWMLASELATAGIAVIAGPSANLPGNFDRINARLGSASILINAGVKVAIADADARTHNARNLTQSAGNAVALGLGWDAALRAITLSPAEIYGMAATTGSIEPGKAADIVIWPADPLELTNYPEQVFINGEAMPMVSRQTLLRDRYLQTDMPPAYRK